MRAILYLRMSSDRSGDELGVTRQREDCLALAAVRGWDVVGEYMDNDTSAAGKVKRPRFEAMLTAIKAGEADVVIAWNLDRLTRNRQDTVRLIELGQDKRLTIALARGSDLDMSTPMGRMMADQLAGWARYEIEQKSERHKRANEQRAKKGLPHKGRRAFGYNADGLTVNEDEALVLKDIAAKFLSGYSYTQLADYLNERGHVTVEGRRFYGVAIRQMLQRVRYNGVREHDGVHYEAAWPAIFDDDTWARIQHKIRERSAAVNFRPQPRRHLLTGLVTCSNCGAGMNGTTTYDRKTGQPRKTYRCNRNRLTPDGKSGCGLVSRGSIPLEHFIREIICYRLDSDELRKMLSQDNRAYSDLLRQRESKVARLDALVLDYADGTLTKAEFTKAKRRVEGFIQNIDRELSRTHLADTGVQLGSGEQIRQQWKSSDQAWRRSMIELLIDHIEVQPSRKLPRIKIDGKTYYFDSRSVLVHWLY